MKTSVCMSTYNGSKYVEIQLSSILSQLRQVDEVIVVDDDSSDDTINLVQKFQNSNYLNFRNDNICKVRWYVSAASSEVLRHTSKLTAVHFKLIQEFLVSPSSQAPTSGHLRQSSRSPPTST